MSRLDAGPGRLGAVRLQGSGSSIENQAWALRRERSINEEEKAR